MDNDDLSTTIMCEASGNPRPSVQWMKCHSGRCSPYQFHQQQIDVLDEHTVMSTLNINRTNPSEIGKISCQSVNKCKTVPGNTIWTVKKSSLLTVGKIILF